MTLLAQARRFWHYYISAWIYFPVLFVAVRVFGVSLAEAWLVIIPFSLLAGIGPWVPFLQSKTRYWPTAFWAILVPVANLLSAVAVAQLAGAA